MASEIPGLSIVAEGDDQSTFDYNLLHTIKVQRPWGSYECLLTEPHFQVKRLVINPGAKISLQLHYHRVEHWVIVEGAAEVILNEAQMQLTRGQHVYIPKETKHRLANVENSPLIVIETQLGDYLGEDDIVRFEDMYKRKTL
jgi:mannose-1-phosphate guanylyltransferase / mannose-6-phosphate isomerase